MVRREDISSRLQRIQEENSPTIPSAVSAVVAAPHINGLAAEMYNDPLLVAIALHFEEDEHEAAVQNSLLSDGHSSDDGDDGPGTPAITSAVRVLAEEPIAQQKSSRHPARPPRTSRRPQEVGELPKRSGQKGTRRVRRAENDLNLLRSAAGIDERIDGALDQIRSTNSEKSLFADFFDSETSENNRKVWNQFLQLSEEKQQRVLQKLDAAEKHRGAATKKDNASKEKSEFAAIDRRLRQMLIRQKPPPAMVRQVEDAVISAFAKEPHSVQLYRKLDGFRRSIYHSVCQYAKLTSKTLNKRGGAVVHNNAVHADVEVRNQRKEFTCPEIMLSDYLEKSREEHRG